MVTDLLFYVAFFVLATITLIAGLATVTLRNVFHSALALVGTFFGVAGIYLLLEAEFLAVVQVLIYVGAISVLILFAIMLTRGLMKPGESATNGQWATAAVMALFLFFGMLLISLQGPWPGTPVSITTDLIPALGTALLTTYVLPFEIASILLLAALVGALIIARD